MFVVFVCIDSRKSRSQPSVSRPFAQDYVRRVLLAIPASNMKADNEADAEKQDWPDWQTGGRQVADWDAGRAMSNVEHVHPLAL